MTYTGNPPVGGSGFLGIVPLMTSLFGGGSGVGGGRGAEGSVVMSPSWLVPVQSSVVTVYSAFAVFRSRKNRPGPSLIMEESVPKPSLLTKDLFLNFAGLVRKAPLSRDKALQVMLEWITSYGVLGLEGLICPDEVPKQTANNRERRESLRGFWHAVERAAWCLELYEAANAPDEQAAPILARHHASGGTLRAKKEWARVVAADTVGIHVSEDCYPIVYRATKRISRAIHGFEAHETVSVEQGWDFRSLLGAMYLQMMFYMEGGGGGRPCKRPGCYRPVSFESAGDPGPINDSRRNRKTPSNKVFCGTACRVWWNQNHGNSKKAKQKRERERRKANTS